MSAEDDPAARPAPGSIARIRRSAALDVVSSGVSRVVLLVGGSLAGILVAREYGVTGKGEIALVTAVAGNTANVLSLGVNVAVIHFAGRRSQPAADLLWAVVRISSVLAPLTIASSIIATYALSFDLPAGHQPFALLAATMAGPMLLAVFLQAALIAAGRLVEVAALTALRGLIVFLGVLAVVLLDWGSKSTLLAYAAAEYVALAATFWALARSHLHLKRSPHRRLVRGLLGYGLQGHVGALLQGVNYRLDVILVAALLNIADVGLYSVAVTAAEVLWTLPLILANFVTHRIASDAEVASARVVRVTAKLTVGFLMVGATTIGLLAPILLPVVFGSAFTGSVHATWILLPGVCLMALYINMMNDLGGRGYPRVKSGTAFLACVTTVVLDLVLIPRMGIEGAAIASSCAYAVAFLSAAPIYRRLTGVRYRDWVPTMRDVLQLRDLSRPGRHAI